MKTFTTSLFAILLICMSNCVFSQDEIYNEKPKKVIVVDSTEFKNMPITKNDSSVVNEKTTQIVGDEYYTEDDYYDEKYGENYRKENEEVIVYTEEDVAENDAQPKHNNEGLRVITEVVVEVFFNVLFAFALSH